RWNPVDGYTDTLLPTDRWQWTDESGLNPQPLHSFVGKATGMWMMKAVGENPQRLG
ncbi:hypothetical protein M9458_007061, partial [Cirrhinus mrigala]